MPSQVIERVLFADSHRLIPKLLVLLVHETIVVCVIEASHSARLVPVSALPYINVSLDNSRAIVMASATIKPGPYAGASLGLKRSGPTKLLEVVLSSGICNEILWVSLGRRAYLFVMAKKAIHAECGEIVAFE